MPAENKVFEIFEKILNGQQAGVAKAAFLVETNLALDSLVSTDIIEGHLKILQKINAEQAIEFNAPEIERQFTLMSSARLHTLTKDLLTIVLDAPSGKSAKETYQTEILKALLENKIINKLSQERTGNQAFTTVGADAVVTRDNINKLPKNDVRETVVAILQIEANKLNLSITINQTALARTGVGDIKAALAGIIEHAFTLTGEARSAYFTTWVNSIIRAQQPPSTKRVTHQLRAYSAILGRDDVEREEMSLAENSPARLVTGEELQALNSFTLYLAVRRRGLLSELTVNDREDLLAGRNKNAICNTIAHLVNNELLSEQEDDDASSTTSLSM